MLLLGEVLSGMDLGGFKLTVVSSADLKANPSPVARVQNELYTERVSTGGGHPRTNIVCRARFPVSLFRYVSLRKPAPRPSLPPRRSNNDKRRLKLNPDPIHIALLQQNVTYRGSAKHKQHPHLYDLEPFQGKRGDETLCDRDANFGPADYESIPQLLRRSLQAGLLGENDIIWVVADNGWIYEARITNVIQTEYHGYPVRSTEAIAEMVYERFMTWAQNNGNQTALQAANNCKNLYGFK